MTRTRRSVAAIKKAREREREREGVAVYTIRTHRNRLVRALLRSSRLSEAQGLHHRDVEAALADVVAEWVERWHRHPE